MKKTIVTIAAALVLVACSSTRIISSWVGTVPSNTMNKVLVFSLVNKSEIQDSFEDAIVADLKRHHVNAESAFDVFGPDALKKKDKEQLAASIRKGGYTGIMLISLLDKEQSEDYTPPTTTTYAVPVGPVYYDPWFYPYYRCYNYYYDQVTTPGYWTTTTTYIIEARLYNATDENDAVYVGKTATQDPSDAYQMSVDFANSITNDMVSKKLIK